MMSAQEVKTPLRRAREARGLTIDEAAAKLGIDQGNLSRIERGLQTPSKEALAEIAREFDLSELEILYPERYVA